MAAAEIQGFEANAEHYLVVKEWIPTMGDGFDNKGGEIRSSPKKKKKSIKKTRVTPYTGIILPSCGNYVVVISCFFQDFYWRLVKYDHFTWEFCDLVYGIVI